MNENPLAARPDRAAALVSVVIPVFNEHAVLVRLHQSVSRSLAEAGVRREIVFVDDGSTDDSPRTLDALAQRDPCVRAVHLSRNFGHQAALQAGLATSNGDAVICMDADMQDDPAALPRFIEAWLAGSDVVYAVRTARKESLAKRLMFTGFYRLLQRIATTPMPLDAGAFGLLDRRVVREVVGLGERDRYLPGLRSWVGFRQTGVEVERGARYDDHPRVSLRGLWRLAKTAVFSFSTFPLSVFYAIGYSALAVFALLAGFSLFCKLFTNLAIPGWTSHVLSASFFGALNALGICILGEYVVRIYDQVRGRPVYLIDRVVARQAPESADVSYLELLDAVESMLADGPPRATPTGRNPREEQPAIELNDRPVSGRAHRDGRRADSRSG